MLNSFIQCRIRGMAKETSKLFLNPVKTNVIRSNLTNTEVNLSRNVSKRGYPVYFNVTLNQLDLKKIC